MYGSESYDSGENVAATDENEPSGAESYDYGAPYGNESYSDQGMDYSRGYDEADETASQMGLSAYLPGELLNDDDQALIRQLSGMVYEDSEARRSVLESYLHNECSEILGLADRLEEATGTEVLELADDLAGTAAFLAVFRLVERSDLSVDQAVVVLEEGLESLPEQWISEVDTIANGADESTASVSEDPCKEGYGYSQDVSAFDIVKAWTERSVSNLGGAIRNIALPTVSFDLPSLTDASEDERTAADPAWTTEQSSF